MDDHKEKTNTVPEGGTGGSGEQALHDELEDLARVFQEELDRAKAEAKAVAENGVEEPEILIQGLDDLPENAAHTESVTEEYIPEEELCECCGENRRGTKKDPNSVFCEECDAGLRRYPFDFINVLLALAVICFVFFGGYVFATHTETFVAVQKADTLWRDNQKYSALDAYASAESVMKSAKINGEMVYKRNIMTAYELGLINTISEPAENIQPWEMRLPHFRSLKNVLDTAYAITETMNAAADIVMPYQTAAASEIPYEELLGKLDALKTQALSASETQTDSGKGYQPQASEYDVPSILFYQYYLALLCEKDMETQIAVLEEIQADYPDYLWIYGDFLGELYAKTGRDVEPICKAMEKQNAENGAPEMLRAISLRVAGDYDGAIAICDAAIDSENEMVYEIYREKSLCCLLKGTYAEAYTAANLAFQSTSPSVRTCNTLALCALAAGQTDAFNEVKELLENSGFTLSSEVTDYQNGTRTIESILKEGDLDIT